MKMIIRGNTQSSSSDLQMPDFSLEFLSEQSDAWLRNALYRIGNILFLRPNETEISIYSRYGVTLSDEARQAIERTHYISPHLITKGADSIWNNRYFYWYPTGEKISLSGHSGSDSSPGEALRCDLSSCRRCSEVLFLSLAPSAVHILWKEAVHDLMTMLTIEKCRKAEIFP